MGIEHQASCIPGMRSDHYLIQIEVPWKVNNLTVFMFGGIQTSVNRQLYCHLSRGKILILLVTYFRWNESIAYVIIYVITSIKSMKRCLHLRQSLMLRLAIRPACEVVKRIPGRWWDCRLYKGYPLCDSTRARRLQRPMNLWTVFNTTIAAKR